MLQLYSPATACTSRRSALSGMPAMKTRKAQARHALKRVLYIYKHECITPARTHPKNSPSKLWMIGRGAKPMGMYSTRLHATRADVVHLGIIAGKHMHDFD